MITNSELFWVWNETNNTLANDELLREKEAIELVVFCRNEWPNYNWMILPYGYLNVRHLM